MFSATFKCCFALLKQCCLKNIHDKIIPNTDPNYYANFVLYYVNLAFLRISVYNTKRGDINGEFY